MDIEFQGRFDRSEYFRAFQLISRPTSVVHWLRVGGAVLLFALIIAFFVNVIAKDGAETSDILRLLQFSISMTIIAYLVLLPYIASFRVAQKLWSDPIIRGQQQGRVNSMGIYYESRVSEFMVPWEKYVRMRRTDDFIVLLTADGLATILPRSFFSGDQEWKYFNHLIDERVKEAR